MKTLIKLKEMFKWIAILGCIPTIIAGQGFGIVELQVTFLAIQIISAIIWLSVRNK